MRRHRAGPVWLQALALLALALVVTPASAQWTHVPVMYNEPAEYQQVQPVEPAVINPEPVEFIGYADLGGDAPTWWTPDTAPAPDRWHVWKHNLWNGVCDTGHDLCSDFRHNYSWENLGWMALGVAVAAPFANTDLDDNFSGWYQRHARGASTDEFSRIGKVFGNHEVMVPIYVGLTAAGWLWPDNANASWCGEWSQRTLRAMMVGAPAVGALQYGLGGHRPHEGSTSWRPFDDTNGVAGHGFIGALPFLTAASMTENRWAKGALFVGSFWTCWSRLHDDSHSLSQCMLGWWMAYLAVESVNQTEMDRRYFVAPYFGPDQVGVTVFIPF